MDLQTTDDFMNYVIAIKQQNAQLQQQLKQLTEEMTHAKAELDALKKEGEKK